MVAPESAVVTVCSVGGGTLVVVTTSPPETGSKSVVVVLVGETLCVVLVSETLYVDGGIIELDSFALIWRSKRKTDCWIRSIN